MGLLEDYKAKLPEIQAVPTDDLLGAISIPVDHYVHEAKLLYESCQRDKTELVKAGLDWKIVAELPVLSNALSQAESFWMNKYYTEQEVAALWKEKSPRIFELRSEMIHYFRFAFRNNAKTLSLVNRIAGSLSYVSMLQDLNDLAVLGKNNMDALKAVKFNMALLDEAAAIVYELRPLLAKHLVESKVIEEKLIRDQALVLVKRIVDEICAFGQFLFWKKPMQKKNYASPYLRRLRSRQTREKKQPENDAADESKGE